MWHCIDSIPDVAWTHAWEWEGFSHVGFNEAWAHLVSASVLNNPIKIRGCGGINGKLAAYFNLENPWDFRYSNGAGQIPPYRSGKHGELCEATITGALWDIYDHSNEPHDTLNIGSTESAAFDTIFNVLRNFDPWPGTNPGNVTYNRCRIISDFQDGWATLYGLYCHKKALTNIYEKHKIGFIYSSISGINVTGRSLCCDVDWQLSSDTSGVKEFIVERSDYEYGPYAIVDTINYVLGETLYTKTDSAVQYNMPYWYRVAQVDSSDFIAYSEADSASPFDLAAPPAAPAPATGLTAIDRPSDQGRAINLSWTKSANDPGSVTKYYIYRSFNQTSGFTCNDSVAAGTVAYTDTTAIDGDTLYYFIRAHNGVNGAKSNTAWGISKDNIPPAPPSGLSINVDSLFHVRLAWHKNTEPDIWGYRVYRSLTSGSGYALITVPVTLDTAYLDTTTVNGRSYFYVVTALDNASPANESSFSSEVSIHLSWLSTSPLATGFNNAKKLVCDTTGTNLHLVYQSNDKVWYTKSADGGASWSADTAIGEGRYPAIALDKSGNPNVVWSNKISSTQDKLYFSRCGASGWTVPFELGAYPTGAKIDMAPSLTISKADTAFICWKSGVSTMELLSVIWAGWFNILSPSLKSAVLDTVTLMPYPWCPAVAVDTIGAAHFAWDDKPPMYYAISYCQRGKNGQFTADEIISQGLENGSPCLDFSRWQNSIDAVWEGSLGRGVDYRSRLDTATAWEPIRQIDSTGIQPVIAAGGYAAFSRDNEIFLKRKVGNVWPDSTEKNISNTSAISNYPQIAFSQTVSGSNLYIAWTEGNAAPYEIKFAKISVPSVAKVYVDAGGEVQSPYCVQRAGYRVFGPESYQTIDYHPQRLIYKFGGFKKNKKYSVEAVYYYENSLPEREDKGGPRKVWVQELDIDGTLKVKTKLTPGQRIVVNKPIPPAAYNKDGEVLVYIDKVSGDYALCAEIFLYEFDKDYEENTNNKAVQTAQAVSSGLPLVTAVYQNAPNPTNGNTTITYQIAERSKVSLKVYNTLGQVVKIMVEEGKEPGAYRATWDGNDQAGQPVASGVYFYRLSAGSFNDIKKLVLIR